MSYHHDRDTASSISDAGSSEDSFKYQDVVFKESNSLKSIPQLINSNLTFLYLGGWFGCRAGRIVGKNKDYGLSGSSIGFSMYSIHSFMPMVKEIFEKLRENKFKDLKHLADGHNLDSADKSDNYVYFFMPGESDLESKFRIALIVYETGKLGFCRYFIPAVYKDSDCHDWTLAKNSRLIFDTRLQFLSGVQNIVDTMIFSTARRSHWGIPVFHLYHQYFYMNKRERDAFFNLPFSRKKTLASRALEFLPAESSGTKVCKNQFLQMVGDLREALFMISDISDILADLTVAEGGVYLFTRLKT